MLQWMRKAISWLTGLFTPHQQPRTFGDGPTGTYTSFNINSRPILGEYVELDGDDFLVPHILPTAGTPSGTYTNFNLSTGSILGEFVTLGGKSYLVPHFLSTGSAGAQGYRGVQGYGGGGGGGPGRQGYRGVQGYGGGGGPGRQGYRGAQGYGGGGGGAAGALALLETHVVSGATDVIFSNFSSNYDNYLILAENLYSSSASDTLDVLFGYGAGPTFDTGSNYSWCQMSGTDSNSLNSTGGLGTTSLNVLHALLDDNAGFSVINLQMTLFSTQTASSPKGLDWQAFLRNNVGNRVTVNGGGAWSNTTNAVTALKLIPGSGNLTGTFRMYGYATTTSSSGSSNPTPGNISGLNLVYTGAETFNVQPGYATDTTMTQNLTITSTQAVNLATTGINGIDTVVIPSGGTVATSTSNANVTGAGTAFFTDFAPNGSPRTITGTISSSSTTVTGTSTAFMSQVAVGDLIGNSTTGYYRVTAIASDTSLTLVSAPGGAFSAATVSVIENATFQCNSQTVQQINTITSNTALTLAANSSANVASGGTAYAGALPSTPDYLMVWLGGGTSGTNVWASTQRTTPFGVSGYNSYVRRIGSLTWSGSLMPQFQQTGTGLDRRYNLGYTASYSTVLVNNYTGSGAWQSVSASGLISPFAVSIYSFISADSSSTWDNYFSRRDFVALGTNNVTGLLLSLSASGHNFTTLWSDIQCDGAQGIAYYSDQNSGLTIYYYGYTESLAIPPVASSPSFTATPDAVNGRLTLTSGVPVTTTDVTGATSVYWTPYKGNQISLFTGVTWNTYSFSEISIAVPATTNTPFDIFAKWNGSTVVLTTVNWTNGTTRATALSVQNGRYVLSTDATQRYLGTGCTTGVSGQCEDSNAGGSSGDAVFGNRLLWNYYNRVSRSIQAHLTTLSWNGNGSNSYRVINGNAALKAGFVIGVSEDVLDATQFLTATMPASTDAIGGIGFDSQTVVQDYTTSPPGGNGSAYGVGITMDCIVPAFVRGQSPIGYHYMSPLEFSNNSAVAFSNNSFVASIQG